MEKKLLLLVIAFFMMVVAFSQSSAVISGRVIDQASKEPLPFASISVVSRNDGKLLTETVSKEDGRFVLEKIPQNEYLVKVLFIGYSQKEIPLLVGKLNSTFDMKSLTK